MKKEEDKIMTSITLNIPRNYTKILDDLNDSLYVEALNTVVKKKLREKERELREIRKKQKRFEVKYNCLFEEYEKIMADSIKAHDDWIAWTYLKEREKQILGIVNKIKFLISK
ncbi:MAG: hypothetical protein L3J08_08165 [Flavobacteriaceae bacterium]|nr:hypothetical protein [Flavobacteriaceae bacterium]